MASDGLPTLADVLESYFDCHVGQWVDGRELAKVAGAYAWRTRVSELRRPPYNMVILNRKRRIKEPGGRTWTLSEYSYQPDTPVSTEGQDA